MAFPTRHRNRNTPPAWHAPATRQYDWPFEPMEAAWPERLFRTSMTQLTKDDVDQIRSELFEFNRSFAEDAPRDSIRSDGSSLYPARLLIVDQS